MESPTRESVNSSPHDVTLLVPMSSQQDVCLLSDAVLFYVSLKLVGNGICAAAKGVPELYEDAATTLRRVSEIGSSSSVELKIVTAGAPKDIFRGSADIEA